MIIECMIFLASVLPMGADETKAIEQYMGCNDHVPKSMQQHAELYVEHFDRDNIDVAVRIGWCESRGKVCLLYTSPSPRDRTRSRMPSSA